MNRFLIALCLVAGALFLPTAASAQVCTYVEGGGTGNTRSCVGSAEQPLAMASLTTPGTLTVTTGGTSQQVFAVLASRRYLICQNPISATEPLYLNFGTAASTANNGSIEIAIGGSFSMHGGTSMYTGTVNVTAATTGHYFICKQGN